MQALSDDQQVDRLEKKKNGLATKIEMEVDRLETKIETEVARLETKIEAEVARLETKIESVRSEARSDFRTLFGVQMTMFMAMILGFAGIFFQLS